MFKQFFILKFCLVILINVSLSQNTSMVLGIGYLKPKSVFLDNKNAPIKEYGVAVDLLLKKRIGKINYFETGLQFQTASMEFEHNNFYIDFINFDNRHKIKTRYNIIRIPFVIQTKIARIKKIEILASYGLGLEKIINGNASIYNSFNDLVHKTTYSKSKSLYNLKTPALFKINISPLFNKIGLSYSYIGNIIFPSYDSIFSFGYYSIEMFVKSNFHMVSITYKFNLKKDE